MIIIVETSPLALEARALLVELDAALMEHDYPPESRHAFSVERLIAEHVMFFVLIVDGTPAACGGIKLCPDYAEVKRMYVRPEYRGQKLSHKILTHLETTACSNGVGLLRLETGIHQHAAISIYRSAGFVECGPFGEYVLDPNSVYLEKQLTV